ncbi:hypothetical protein GUITHDRAFT_108075 [Guillardia theta CCMP2712]|uniref:Uncharacterized protein n=1 Tax=Guillardia theta (strain CCMP2712) TaxID=905079 RepID=L1JBW2_GUITC|nr:hypothetical protein GUITHDRAFT_108075 [Guillardia theta CCMP2712]EKX46038.1 hypothetical protein GUITHDRAFT_108075 [Guillardia theta CCMP2712]|eukprot:XP_005833018.1 hypothetical protein GUITHDRAFT_108075 [Guillardia theta CCMP2712]
MSDESGNLEGPDACSKSSEVELVRGISSLEDSDSDKKGGARRADSGRMDSLSKRQKKPTQEWRDLSPEGPEQLSAYEENLDDDWEPLSSSTLSSEDTFSDELFSASFEDALGAVDQEYNESLNNGTFMKHLGKINITEVILFTLFLQGLVITSCDLQGLDDNDEVKQKIERSELVAFLAKHGETRAWLKTLLLNASTPLSRLWDLYSYFNTLETTQKADAKLLSDGFSYSEVKQKKPFIQSSSYLGPKKDYMFTDGKEGRGYYQHGLLEEYVSEENSTDLSIVATSDPDKRKNFFAVHDPATLREESEDEAGDELSFNESSVDPEMNATAWREMYSRIYASAWNSETKNKTNEGDPSEQENVENEQQRESEVDEDMLAVKDLYRLVPPPEGWQGRIEEVTDKDLKDLPNISEFDERDRTEWPAEEWEDVDPDKIEWYNYNVNPQGNASTLDVYDRVYEKLPDSSS